MTECRAKYKCVTSKRRNIKRTSVHLVMLFITIGLLETQETHSVLHFFQSLRIRQYCWETPFCLGVITVIHAGMGMSEAQQECEMCCLLNLIMH